MIDFSDCPVTKKPYGGANGSKIQIIYNNVKYMLKFSSLAKHNNNIKYTNGVVSEYLGCHIFNFLGVEAQETLLGYYSLKDNVEKKIVVACKDFEEEGVSFYDFASIKNLIIDSERNGYGTDLYDILESINKQTHIETEKLLERFWNMFIIDAFIGNWDRHNGNWGTLYNSQKNISSLAPVFDCGSSLFPQADKEVMISVLTNQQELNSRIYNIPTSAITMNHKRINYFDFISSGKFADCNKALNNVLQQLNMDQIDEFIDSLFCISELNKTFLKTVLNEKKEK